MGVLAAPEQDEGADERISQNHNENNLTRRAKKNRGTRVLRFDIAGKREYPQDSENNRGARLRGLPLAEKDNSSRGGTVYRGKRVFDTKRQGSAGVRGASEHSGIFSGKLQMAAGLSF